MRVVYFGTSAYAVPVLERLAHSDHRVVACVSRPDRPQGRGLKPAPSPVKAAAERLGLIVQQPERPRADAIAPLEADVGVVVAYGQLLRRDLLEAVRFGLLGVHPSLLPKYRGAAPVPWAILNGEPETGVCIYRLVEALDAGPVLIRRIMPIAPEETSEGLSARLSTLGAEALIEALHQLSAGTAKETPQRDEEATFAPKLTKAQGTLDWRLPARELERQVRAFVPWPVATAWRGGEPLRIFAASACPDARSGAAPGTVVRASSDGIAVATGQGELQVLEVQPGGRRRMPAAAFVAGRGIAAGDRFETPPAS